jgi:hypothetical protein
MVDDKVGPFLITMNSVAKLIWEEDTKVMMGVQSNVR